MYESPLSVIFGEIQTKIIEERENQVIQALQNCGINVDKEELIKALMYDRQQYKKGYADAKAEEPPFAQPEQSLEIQGILDYLDTVLHPIISPEHWNVYSELYDMISMLPFAQPEIIRCQYCKYARENRGELWICAHPDNNAWRITEDFYCGRAERRENERDQ